MPKKSRVCPLRHLKANPSSVVRVISPEMEGRVARGACRAREVAPPTVAPPAVAVVAEAVSLPHARSDNNNGCLLSVTMMIKANRTVGTSTVYGSFSLLLMIIIKGN